jgi:PAT family beta-lactamase induction signal transducer AmpG
MAALMRRQGMDIGQIGAFVATFYLPWAFKWAWAPLVDLVTLNRFGGRTAWIAICQALMIVTLIGIARVDYAQHFDLLIILVIVHNVFAATNDVAIDSLAVNTLREEERAQGNGFMFAGAYLGQGLGGGGALFVSGLYGFNVAFIYVSLVLSLVLLFVLVFVRDPAATSELARKTTAVWRELAGTLKHFLGELKTGFFKSGRGPLIGVAFALLPFGAMALFGAVSTTLQVDIGLSDNQIATLNVINTMMSAIGCIFGGWMADKLGKRRMLMAYYSLTILPTLYLAITVSGESGIEALTITRYYMASLPFYFIVGMHYGTSAAIFMGLTNPAVAATQFTGYMALRNLTIAYTNGWQGAAVQTWSYGTVFYIDAALAVIPVLIVPFLVGRKTRETPPSAGAPLPEAG